MRSHAQVAVIGGGIVGCSILYHLTRLGWRDVVLLERSELTSGSTWHAAANMHMLHGVPNVARLQRYSAELYRRLEAETGQSCGIHNPGGLYLASSRERLDEFRSQRARARYLGLEFEFLTMAEVKRLNPLVRTDGLHGAMFDPADSHVDPAGVPHALAKGARAAGAEILRHTPVVELAPHEDGDWRVVTPQGTIIAERVVNAAGLWAREVGRLAGACLPLQPMEHQYLVTDRIPELAALGREIPLTRDYDAEYYLRQEGQGLLLGAYERDGKPWAVEGTPADFGQELLAPDIDRIAGNYAAAAAQIPCLAEAGIKRVVNGPMVFSPDGLPLLGPMPGLRNYWVAAGVMAGFSQGGGIGMALAEWLVEGEPPMDLFALDVARFGDYATPSYTLARVRENYSKRFGIAYPFEEREAGRPARTTPVYDRQKAAGAVFGPVFGLERPLWFAPEGAEPKDVLTFRRPNWFEAAGREARALRAGVGLIDISSFAKYEVEGPGAELFLDRLLANRLPSRPGRICLSPMLNPKGGIVGDFTVTRLAEERFYLLGSGAAERYHLRRLAAALPAGGVHLRAVSAERGAFAIAGPNARALLARLTSADVSNGAFPFLTACELDLGPARALVLRVAYTGDLGYELHVPIERQAALYEALLAAGRDLGLTLVGARAMDSLRLEKSYGRWGAEYTADVAPREAKLDRYVRLDKGEFVGRDALLRSRNEPPRYALVTLTVDAADADCVGNEPVWHDGEVVGSVSSGGFGHSVGKSIALAYVRPVLERGGAEFAVEILGDKRPAALCGTCLFDPAGLRLRG
ncbi:MAG: dehydrogenase [Alphaproteobacteria bacterium]|nr:MAG: dehydrogenase [Alphaproteobacteria bacterium]